LFALEVALGERDLDFCLVLTSLSAILGGLGLAAFASACGFADRFVARHNRRHPTSWISMNWDGWLSGDTSMLGEAHKELAIQWSEGLEAVSRVVAHGGFDQIALSAEDLPARLDVQYHQRESREAIREAQYTVHPRPNLTNPYVAPRNETEEKIAEIWQRRLGIEQVGIHDNYFDLGGDSLLIVKIRRSLQEAFGEELLTSDLFEHPTVAALASYFNNRNQTVSMDQVKSRAQRQLEAMEAEQAEMMRARRARRTPV
jgi:acyl carrier protein